MSKSRLESFTSPAGEAVFPWLTKPDTVHDAAGVYHTDLSIPFDLAQDFIARLEGVRDSFIQTLPVNQQSSLKARDVYTMEMTRPEYGSDLSPAEKAAVRGSHVGEETGNVLFRFKLKASVQPRDGEAFTQAPIVVTADTGERVESPVYGGSIIRVRGQIVPYTNAAAGIVGITLRMKAVQVIELVTAGSGGGENAGYWTNFEAA